MSMLATTPPTANAPLPGNAQQYQPGVCNIGPAEIEKRKRAGNFGVVVTIVTFLLLVSSHASPLVRFLIIGLLAAGTAACYLEAYMRFCGAFGIAGVFNFGRLGATQKVLDKEARARDRVRVLQLIAYSVVIGSVVGATAALLPI
jgi:membrane-bound ClpP family serine protease